MKAFIIAAMLVLLPAVALAAPTMGIYFSYTPGQMHYFPMVPFDQFYGYVYVHNSSCYLNAVEFMVVLPPGIAPMSFELPPGALSLGDPYSGFAVSFWPPLDGWNPGYNLVCSLKLLAIEFCAYNEAREYIGGSLMDLPIRIAPSPTSGLIAGVCYPDNEMFPILGLTSTICPYWIAVQEKSWGAIKSMYR